MIERTCVECGTEITTGRSDKRYCDRKCAKRFWDRNNPERKREQYTASRARHREAVNARVRQRRVLNPEKYRERDRRRDRREWQKSYRWVGKPASDRKYRQANREKINAYLRRYYAENPERIAAIRQARTARKRGAPGWATAGGPWTGGAWASR